VTLQIEGTAGSAPADPDGPEADEVERLNTLLTRVRVGSHVVRRLVSVERVGPRPSPLHVRATVYLTRHEPCTVGELATALDVSLGWASRVVDELVTNGLAERERDPADRRIVHLRLTPTARAFGEEIYRVHAEAIERALEPTEPTDREVIFSFLARLAEEYERHASQREKSDCRDLSA
jgi:DNA-binding MarR family transcriptional regulator